MRIIDAHVHLGNNRQTKYYSLRELRRDLKEAGAQGAVVFAFPEDIYRKLDSPAYRLEANNYVLEVADGSENLCLYPFYFVWNDYILKAAKDAGKLYPFYFVWNDYLIPPNLDEYAGIKWHRHWNEPRYDYDNPKCAEVLERIEGLEMPVVLEEEYVETLHFVEKNPEVKVIIPHMGKLNGGCDRMEAFFDNPNVYFDTSTAPLEAIRRILDRVGAGRIIFGSDVSGTREPFYNFPKVELKKVLQLDLDEAGKELIFARNIEGLMARWISG
ncbi:MAG: amidohydrolase family protein [Candidatus Bathyarchaeia archaeon]